MEERWANQKENDALGEKSDLRPFLPTARMETKYVTSFEMKGARLARLNDVMISPVVLSVADIAAISLSVSEKSGDSFT